MEATVSVIVPVYNTEDRIKICVESICKQTYKQLQIVVVNDGSTDRTASILSELQKKDDRIQIIKQTNAGVSCARNVGLQAAVGEWIAFVDADDYLEPSYVETLLKNREELTDIIICGYKLREENIEKTAPLQPKEIFEGDNGLVKLLARSGWEQQLSLWNPWGKLISGKLIRQQNLLFDEKISLGEDTLFVLEYYGCARKIVCIYDPLYIYWRRDSSLSQYVNTQNYGIGEELRILHKKVEILQKRGLYNESSPINETVYNVIKEPALHFIYGPACSFEKIKSSYFKLLYDDKVQFAAKNHQPKSMKRKAAKIIILGKMVVSLSIAVYLLNRLMKLKNLKIFHCY